MVLVLDTCHSHGRIILRYDKYCHVVPVVDRGSKNILQPKKYFPKDVCETVDRTHLTAKVNYYS